MKKTILLLSLVLLSNNFVFASIDTNLKYGARGSEVSELQEFLVDKGFITTSPSGFFGFLTLKAVKAYQLSQNLPSTGYVGSMTRAKINTEIIIITNDSTQSEIKETGTTTQATKSDVSTKIDDLARQLEEQKKITEQTKAFAEQIAKNTTPVVPQPYVVPEGDYNLSLNNLANSGYAVSFKPKASLNGMFLPVNVCWPTVWGEARQNEAIKHADGTVVIYGNSGYMKDISDGIPGTVTCTLANGKTLTN